MLFSYLDQPQTYDMLLQHKAWETALDWLKRHQGALPDDGEYELQGRDMRALVQTVETKPRAERKFEAHQREVDLQCCFTGSEIIEWAPTLGLLEQTVYDHEKDFTWYQAPAAATALRMVPGTFAIFFPSDGHMPGIRADDDVTRKAVIKINTALLTGKTVVLGPFHGVVDPRFSDPEGRFNLYFDCGRFDRVNSQDITAENFAGLGDAFEKNIYLVNFGRSVAQQFVPQELAQLGYRAVLPEWVLVLNHAYPHLKDEHIIITPETNWIGREGATEVICLHNDAGKRRLRTHYADTTWGPHIWFAVEKI